MIAATYLSIINLASTEECIERVVSGYQEASKVDQKGTSNVEEDQECVESKEAEDDIDLRN